MLRRKSNSFKKKCGFLNSFMQKGNFGMEPALNSKFIKYLILAFGIILLGFIVSVGISTGMSVLTTMGFPFGISMILIIMAFTFRYNVTHKGYITYEGICSDHKESIFSLKKRITAMIIQTEDTIIKIPVTKLNEVVPIGSRVKLYIPRTATSYINNGITTFSSIYEYEILPPRDK